MKTVIPGIPGALLLLTSIAIGIILYKPASLRGQSTGPMGTGGQQQHQMPGSQPQPSMPGSQPHAMQHATPEGWTFTMPAGDADRGRHIFAYMECYTCHTIAGESFPLPKEGEKAIGPDLTGMGPLHPREYFAEAILNPSAVILEGSHRGEDSRSKMPDYNEILTLQQWIDLVEYLKSLGEMKH